MCVHVSVVVVLICFGHRSNIGMMGIGKKDELIENNGNKKKTEREREQRRRMKEGRKMAIYSHLE